MTELQSSLPLIDLPNGAQIVLEAVDPLTGTYVSGVTVSNAVASHEGGSAAQDVPALPPLLSFAPGVD